ncbi:MAG: hypothetical protein EON59_03980 [Alphaproteobacteria bacterium]|nr:MAG: hypothetical protein EON59_03980 [Alphaproteobacteria bacterium]
MTDLVELASPAAVWRCLPSDAQRVLDTMRDGWGYPIAYISADANVDPKRTRDLMRAFHALGWADRHAFFSEDDGLVRGSGYSRSPEGSRVAAALRALAAQGEG